MHPTEGNVAWPFKVEGRPLLDILARPKAANSSLQTIFLSMPRV